MAANIPLTNTASLTPDTQLASAPISPESRRFLRHVTAATAFGGGLDGFDLGVISVVILHINHDLELTPAMEGLVGAASLLGIFIGAPLFGFLTDKFGRRRMFLVDIIAFIVIGVGQAFAMGGVSLGILRFLLGMAIGAEYSIGAPMLSEFVPARERGSKLAFLELCWRIGFLIAVLLGYALLWSGVSWKVILATSVIPASLCLGCESVFRNPRAGCCATAARPKHVRSSKKHMGPKYFAAEQLSEESVDGEGYRKLFRKGQRRRTIFVCVFWTCIVTPYFAIFTYAPKVLESLNVKSQAGGTILSNTIGVVGAVVGLLAIDRIGRRRMLIGPFWVQTAVLLIVGLWTDAPSWVLMVGLALFALVNSYSDILTAVYPSEIFDTDIRSSGVGFGSQSAALVPSLAPTCCPLASGQSGSSGAWSSRQVYASLAL
ncbi:hypothetical protein JCM18909_629 [Cutibacterium acnes JCM 18909]|nr:hypothetical protein JCM18909_629 [Cutibacterium acnes JCM 18909]